MLYIKPETGNQYSLGFYKNFNSNNIETSVEVYYKELRNIIDYKSGASVLLNPHIETDVLNSRGKAYGVEFLIKKLNGKLNGWLSYAYSKILLKQMIHRQVNQLTKVHTILPAMISLML
ncbi:MAG: TonB-dependent receptor [Segetibacter sp.]